MSSLWGSLCAYNKEYITDADIEKYDVSFIEDPEPSEYKIIGHSDNGKHVIVKSSEAYKYKFARLKPFLTAFGRLKIMKLIRKHGLEDNLIRIHTDGIVLNKEVDFSVLEKYYPKPEAKTTGKMIYKNAIYGFHRCEKCKELFSYRDFKDHAC